MQRRLAHRFAGPRAGVSRLISTMAQYFSNRLFKIGFWLFVIGCGPLFCIIFLAGIGLWPDADPNPIGPGLLAFLTFWPSIICMVIGVVQTRRGAK